MAKPRSTFLRSMCGTFIGWIALLASLGSYYFVADRYLDIHGDKGPVVAFVYFGSVLSAYYFVIVLLVAILVFFLRDRPRRDRENDA